VADQERLTNKQRRAKAREERSRRERERARQRKRDALRNSLIALVVFAVVGGLVYQAYFTGEPGLDDAILVSSDEIESAEQAAGCETLVERDPLPEAGHFDRNNAPPADLIYPEIRPTHSGPHTAETVPAITGGSPTQLDEMTLTHNLEHGAIVAWYDPAQVDEDTIDEMEEWSSLLNNNGFRNQGGAVIYVSPYEEPGISSGKAIALRAWGTAVDCDEWDETFANGFVAEHYGTRGIGPENAFGPYPSGVLEVSDRDVEESEPHQPEDAEETDEEDLDDLETDDPEADEAGDPEGEDDEE
jgi:hypothetical protein